MRELAGQSGGPEVRARAQSGAPQETGFFLTLRQINIRTRATLIRAQIANLQEKLTQINYNSMILAFAKCGSLQMAIRTLDEMLEKQLRIDSFTSLLSLT